MTETTLTPETTPSSSEAVASPPPPPAASWRDALPETLRDHVGIARYETLEKFAAAKLTLDKHVGVPEERLLRLPEGEDPAAMGKVWDQLGRPSAPDGYELPAPPEGIADVTKETADRARALFHELGLTATQAKALWQFQNEHGAQIMAADKAASEAATAAATAQLKSEWGAQFDARLALAQSYVAKNAAPELVQFLDRSGLADHPMMVKLVGDLVAKIEPSGALPGAGPGGGGRGQVAGMTAGEAQGRINALSADATFMRQLTTAGDPGHGQAMETWRNLNRVAAGG
jgi:hypothetical protein